MSKVKKCDNCGNKCSILFKIDIIEQDKDGEHMKMGFKPMCLRCFLRTIKDIPPEMRRAIPAQYDETVEFKGATHES